jgi:ABC-type nickel/cobalt efflux system permease component RcnA
VAKVAVRGAARGATGVLAWLPATAGARVGARIAARVAAILCVAGALVMLPAAAAAAHPLGNFSVNRYHGLIVEPGELRVDAVQDLAEIPAAQATPRIDADHDGTPSATELAGWAPRACRQAAGALLITLDGRAVPAVARAATARLGAGQAGLPTLRLECRLVAALPGPRLGSVIEFRDRAPAQPGWREVTARGDRMTLLSSDVPAASRSRRLTAYPRDMLSAPLAQRGATLRVRPGGPPLATQDGPGGSPEGVARLLPRGADRLTQAFTALVARRALTPGFAALALALAMALGGLHALAPGHGKTVMAAYAASRGRRSRREVLALGITVTVTHTAGVLALGLLVASGSTLAPTAAIPWLGVASGALVAVTGLTLLRRALRTARHRAAHGHAHPHHSDGHPHPHHSDGHLHPHHGDGHAPSEEGRPRRGSVVLMGFAGGLVPSPSAVVVLVGATALGQAWFGLALVLAYGAGLAASLTLIGVLVAGSGQWLGRRLLAARSGHGRHWMARVPAGALPVGTASLVVALGVGLALRGLPAALG